MVIYAKPSARRGRQVLSDLFTVVWVIACWAASRTVSVAIAGLATPATLATNSVAQVRDSMSSAADVAGKIPVFGASLADPLAGASGGLDGLVAAMKGVSAAVGVVSVTLGWVTFLLPVVLWLVLWAPVRWRFIRNATAAASLIGRNSDLNLFALRAIARQPMYKLAKVSADPVAAWRDGDPAVIAQLAKLELDATGVSHPALAKAS